MRQRPRVFIEEENVHRAIFGDGIWKLGGNPPQRMRSGSQLPDSTRVGRLELRGGIAECAGVSHPPHFHRSERGSEGGWKFGAQGLAQRSWRTSDCSGRPPAPPRVGGVLQACAPASGSDRLFLFNIHPPCTHPSPLRVGLRATARPSLPGPSYWPPCPVAPGR